MSVGNAIKWQALILSIVKVGPLKILRKINDNAYKVKLTSHIRTSDDFNVKHLIPYFGDTSDDELPNSTSNSFEERQTDTA
ncbi:hypothetical protein AMTRI_Chr06g196800 [Amborella trichopoda]